MTITTGGRERRQKCEIGTSRTKRCNKETTREVKENKGSVKGHVKDKYRD
jgi:hypothetical protein